MGAQPHRVVSFRGGVSCRRDPGDPLGLTLVGWASDHPGERVSLAFTGDAPETLPEVLEDATVDRVGESRYRIASAPREWVVEAKAFHLHREIATAFYRAIPPREVPWGKRLFWQVVLGMAASKWGRRVLLRLRR